jgi:hypothetical protein
MFHFRIQPPAHLSFLWMLVEPNEVHNLQRENETSLCSAILPSAKVHGRGVLRTNLSRILQHLQSL